MINDEFELAATLFGSKRIEDGGSSSVSLIMGTAESDSSNGVVKMRLDADFTSDEDDDEAIVDLPTSPSVKQGDSVFVALSGGTSKTPIVIGNAGSGDAAAEDAARAREAAEAAISDAATAKKAAEAAQSDATTAKESANQAISDAATAKSAAEAAQSDATAAKTSAEATAAALDSAVQDAADAKTAAEQAQEEAGRATEATAAAISEASRAFASAEEANSYAKGANQSLSEVERVVGTLNWISEHGHYVSQEGEEFDNARIYYIQQSSYAPTSDVSVDPSKTYYEWDGESYSEVQDPSDDNIASYYEVVSESYTMVDEPIVDDIDSYYVLAIDDSVQNYLASHLALTNDGLRVVGDSTNYSALLSALGLEVVSPVGKSVAVYGENFRLGSTDKVHLLGTSTRLSFHSSSGDIAYFGLDENNIWNMFIEQAYVRDLIRFGHYAWVSRDNGNLTMKYLED